MKTPSVLVGIISYNLERYLPECIESALGQTYPCTIFITDDASTDSSRNIIKKYAMGHENISYNFNEYNSGNCLRACHEITDRARRFNYVRFLCGDDFLTGNSTELLVDYAERFSADWVYGDLDVIDEHGGLLWEAIYDGYPESVPTAIARMWKSKSLETTTTTALFSMRFLEGKEFSKFQNVSFSIDASTAIDFYKSWPRIKRVPEKVAKYRLHPLGETNVFRNDQDRFQIDLVEKMISTFGYENIMACVKGDKNG